MDFQTQFFIKRKNKKITFRQAVKPKTDHEQFHLKPIDRETINTKGRDRPSRRA